jgi:hypothetical protein
MVHTEWLGEGYAEWKGMFGGGEKLVDGNGLRRRMVGGGE